MNKLVLGALLLLPFSVTTLNGEESRKENTVKESKDQHLSESNNTARLSDSKSTAEDKLFNAHKSKDTHKNKDSIVSNLKQLNDKLHVRLASVKNIGKNATKIELAFENWGEQSVKVVNLIDSNALQMKSIVGHSFAIPTGKNNLADIAVPVKASVKRAFYFDSPVEEIDTVKLWGKAFKIS